MSMDWLFVYGTLRPGQGNFERFPGLASDVIEDVYVSGKLYFAWAGSYPVAKITQSVTAHRPFILGTLLKVETESKAFRGVARMEEGAGYVQRRTTTTEGQECIAFHYPGSVDGELRIRSGDWVAEHRYA